MKFKQIVAVDTVNLSEGVLTELQKYSEKPFCIYSSDPKNQTEIIKRIGNADCVLVSWRTSISKDVLEKCANIKYIGLCATSFANIDLEETKNRKIVVSNVSNYGDEATAEWVFAQLLSLARGLGKYQWKEMPCELFGKTLGIIGLGNVGKHVAQLGLGFGMQVLYHSKTRKPEFEEKGVQFMALHDLIKNSDIVSLHVPKNTKVLSKKEFELFKEGAVLVNTCLGEVFDEKDFKGWIKKGKNFAIFDLAISEAYQKTFKKTKNVIFGEVIAARTAESKQRLSARVLENLKAFLEKKPVNIVN